MDETVRILIGVCSYKGPDVLCFRRHYEFMHYLGRLQERSCSTSRRDIPKLDRSNPEMSGELQPTDPKFEFLMADETGNSLIGQARDRIIQSALAAKADYVLFFDDDMMFPNDSLLRLWRHQKPVVGALAFTAREPITPVLYQFNRSWSFEKQSVAVDIQPMLNYPKNQLVRVDAIGTGVVLIDTTVFEKLPEPWFHGAVSAGEDIHFCWKLGQKGIPIYCDTSVKTVHKPNEPAAWMDEAHYEERARRDGIDHRHSDVQ